MTDETFDFNKFCKLVLWAMVCFWVRDMMWTTVEIRDSLHRIEHQIATHPVQAQEMPNLQQALKREDEDHVPCTPDMIIEHESPTRFRRRETANW